MNRIAQDIIDAHGGLDAWRKYRFVSARLDQAGALWGLKGKGGILDHTKVTVATDAQWASHSPFGDIAARSDFVTGHIALLDSDDHVLTALDAPRASFAGHTLETPWTDLQLAFFAGCAMWTYLNTPFVLAWKGVECDDAGSWEEDGETWRKVNVHYPESLEVFSKAQAIYVGPDNLVRRLDYDVEIAGNTPGAHYVFDYVTVSGIRFPTKRRIYPRQPDGRRMAEPLVVSIDLSNIRMD